MVDWRTLALAIMVFCATFASGWWLGLGAKTSAAVSRTPPAQEAIVPVAQPKGITEDEKLRQAVVLRARAYTREHGEDDPEIRDWTWPY